jgi:hypothetical protein
MSDTVKNNLEEFQEIKDMLINMAIQNESMHTDIKKLITMLEPVHSHAEWVDNLRARLHNIGIMRNTPRLE